MGTCSIPTVCRKNGSIQFSALEILATVMSKFSLKMAADARRDCHVIGAVSYTHLTLPTKVNV